MLFFDVHTHDNEKLTKPFLKFRDVVTVAASNRYSGPSINVSFIANNGEISSARVDDWKAQHAFPSPSPPPPAPYESSPSWLSRRHIDDDWLFAHKSASYMFKEFPSISKSKNIWAWKQREDEVFYFRHRNIVTLTFVNLCLTNIQYKSKRGSFLIINLQNHLSW